jgi:hypothetical protein
MQIKPNLRFHYTNVRLASIKNINNNKCWRGYEEKGTLKHCWWRCKLVQALWKAVWRLLKKLKIGLPCDQAIPLFKDISKEI